MINFCAQEIERQFEGKQLYESPGVLTQWANDNLSDVSRFIEKKFGQFIEVDVEKVENPYDVNSLKRLEDLI